MILRRADAGEDLLEMVAAHIPDNSDVQLLRSAGCQSLKPGRDTRQGLFRLAEMGMQTGQGDRRLAGMFRSAAHRRHQPRPTGDRLAPGLWIHQTDEQTPPVVDQCHSAGRELAPMQIMGGEATPTPLVLQLVEGVLGIRPIPVELAQLQNFVIEIGHQHGILIAGDPLAGLAVGFDEAQQLLAIAFLRDQYLALQRSAQHDDTPRRFPPSQLQTTSLPSQP